MRLSLVVPCFNEEAVLARFHEVVREETAGIAEEVELVFVDDGSRDGTLELLKKIAGQDPEAKYVSLSRNFGKESAILAGLKRASGDAVIILDADLQHPPALLGRMVDLHKQGFDQVIAQRDREGDKKFRSLVSKTYYKLINRLVDVELVDGVGDFRLLSRRAVDALLEMPEYNRFSKGLFAWIGFDSVTFNYRNAVREAGETKWSFRRLLDYGVDSLLSFNNKPLRMAIYLGFLFFSISFAYMMWLIVRTMVSGDTTPGYVTTIAAIVGIGGLQMFTVGVIGEYVGRIYYESKQRPHYLVKETESGPLRHQSDFLAISGDHRSAPTPVRNPAAAAGTPEQPPVDQSDPVNGVPGARELNGIQ
ncbi:glycosyltransferase family 2 protein [Catenulispora sp. NL8]|uniref:Glycosyltransferase family 2 protein n=1 Tax=Catenulispora pinistramenti TaxID=2705254 RepID=A0ABS5KJ24_9ACTN|nr:glycosyltransferase family 2 protein [Catenulispora pinistramenti]MBS2546329.1 glycosyltransferase family 2 protein [Catenulispora pinistramenti]